MPRRLHWLCMYSSNEFLGALHHHRDHSTSLARVTEHIKLPRSQVHIYQKTLKFIHQEIISQDPKFMGNTRFYKIFSYQKVLQDKKTFVHIKTQISHLLQCTKRYSLNHLSSSVTRSYKTRKHLLRSNSQLPEDFTRHLPRPKFTVTRRSYKTSIQTQS